MRRFVVLFAILMLALSAPLGCDRAEPEALPNVRLGMSPRDVRDRFIAGSDGAWQTSVGTGDDTVLEWTWRDSKAEIVRARFEFHLGMLVAIRARVAAKPGESETIGLSPKTVSVRHPEAEGGASIVILARDCPTHKDEAESLAARKAK